MRFEVGILFWSVMGYFTLRRIRNKALGRLFLFPVTLPSTSLTKYATMTNTHPPETPTSGTPPSKDELTKSFTKLVEVVAHLRSPEGCPWDREQTLETIKPFTLEETYELLEAIDSGDDEAIVEELGDLLLQVVLDAQIAADEQRFDLVNVIEKITSKMIDRHPHVFGTGEAETAQDVRKHWDHAKKKEKNRQSLLDGIPIALPQLSRTNLLSKKAARVGYDWPHRNMLFDKLKEEIDELSAELFPGGNVPEVDATVEAEIVPDEPIADPQLKKKAQGEIGDVLFVVANIARRWGIDPEEALRSSNRKFEKRFRAIEQGLEAKGKKIQSATLIEMEELYQQAKRNEKKE